MQHYTNMDCYIVSYAVASEWKYFLMFYIPTGLHGILSDKYYVHAFLLIRSMRILLGSYISDNDLHIAERLLNKFCILYEQYYGKIHNTTHNSLAILIQFFIYRNWKLQH